MKKQLLTAGLALAAFSLSAVESMAADVYTKCNWLNDAMSAVSFTFDDGLPNQFSKALPILDKYGFKGTFFIVTDWATRDDIWQTLKEMSENGHEIASHTLTHPSVAGTRELTESKAIIEQKIGKPCLTIAYPYCNFPSDEEALEENYIAGRVCNLNDNMVSPITRDMYNLASFMTGTESAIRTSEDFTNRLSKAYQKKEWCAFLIHEVDGDGYSSTKASDLRSAMSYLSTYVKRNRYWVGTYAEIAQYIKENTSTKVTEVSADADSLVVSLTNSLDTALYFSPLTVKRTMPDGWAQVSATQDGREIKTWVSGSTLYFNAVPNRGDVVIRVTETTRVRQLSQDLNDEPATVSFSNDGITVISEMPVSSLQLSDLSGRTVRSSEGESFMPVGNIPPGNYMLGITLQDGSACAKKLFLSR